MWGPNRSNIIQIRYKQSKQVGIGPNKVYSYISVAIIGFLPLASFLIFGAQWSHLALFCQNPVFLLSDGRIPDSLAFWVMASRTFSFLGGGVWSLYSLLSSFSIFSTCQVGHLECACLMSHISNFWSNFSKTSATPTAGRYTKTALMRWNALFRAKNSFFAHYCVLTQWKHWEWCKCIELCRNRLCNAKTSIPLRLNEFLSKNDVNALKRVISR